MGAIGVRQDGHLRKGMCTAQYNTYIPALILTVSIYTTTPCKTAVGLAYYFAIGEYKKIIRIENGVNIHAVISYFCSVYFVLYRVTGILVSFISFKSA